jgi:hypothetical protein
MNWAKKVYLGLVLGGIVSASGCCYHGQRFGGSRDMGLGKVGCETCDNCYHGSNCASSNCPAQSCCAQAVSARQEYSSAMAQDCVQTNAIRRASFGPVRSAEQPASPVSDAVYVVQPERISSGLALNSNWVLAPMPSTPSAHEPPH